MGLHHVVRVGLPEVPAAAETHAGGIVPGAFGRKGNAVNYAPNTEHWKKGDFVLHDADAKEARCLMIVTGYTRDGLCKTKYVEPDKPRKVYTNPVAMLHDPRRFPKVDYWNGDPVLATAPKRCPFCGSKYIDTRLAPDEGTLDEPLAEAFGYDLDTEIARVYRERPDFDYIVEEADCSECGGIIGYGQRYYWNSESGAYDLPRPLTPAEQQEKERQAQIEAGQAVMFGEERNP